MQITSGVAVDAPVRKKTYQLQAVCKNSAMADESIFNSAISIVGEWLSRKLSRISALRDEVANVFRSVQWEYGNVIVNILYDDSEKVWACKYIQPDRNIAARTWITQVSIYLHENEVHVDILNSCTSPKSYDIPVPLTTPAFVEALNTMIGLHSSAKLSSEPLILGTHLSDDDAFNLITDSKREIPIIFLTPTSSSKEYLISAKDLANKCFGAALVIVLNSADAYSWQNRVGKLWSVFDGGVRTYYSQVDFEEGDMYQHPLMTKQRIIERMEQPDGSAELLEWINFVTRTKSLQHSFESSKLRLFGDVHQYILEKQRAATQAQQLDISETIHIYKMENASLAGRVKELEDELNILEEERLAIEIESEAKDRENFILVSRIDILEGTLADRGQTPEGINYPDDIEHLTQWCEDVLAGRIFLSSKAKKAARKSQYGDIPLIYKVLHLLGHEYRDMRLRKIERSNYEQALKSLGVREEGKPTSRPGEYRDTYYFDYNGKKTLMDYHLRKGTSFNPIETLAVYFSWDESSGKVLIGSLPAHLETRISN